MLKHKCLKCSGVLSQKDEAMECAACGYHWPIINGVPSYGSAKYFGEVSLDAMEQLNRSAEQSHWLLAARDQFKSVNPGMFEYISDLNRASWIPLLPIKPDSTVLDVGSGLGGLTHALALHFRKVVSIEPVKERIRFTRTRLAQEDLKNVDLIQTSLDAIPFFDKTFDLIVLNGILEWVGEWRRGASPRMEQIEVLKALRGLLKPNGLILIGIENRIGFESFLGRLDHPGVRFTSLMPRWMASLYLKLKQPKFHRTLIDLSHGYRTYTYSPRGYIALLKEAGFISPDMWWPLGGYNSPHTLLRIADRKEFRKYLLRERIYNDRIYGYTFRRAIKYWGLVRTGLMRHMVPDLIIMAKSASGSIAEDQGCSGSLIAAVQEVLSEQTESCRESAEILEKSHAAFLMTSKFRNKSVIKLVSSAGTLEAIVKVANVRLPKAEWVEDGFNVMKRIHMAFQKGDAHIRRTVPLPIKSLRVGSWVVTVERPAEGKALDEIITGRQYFGGRASVMRHLDMVSSWLISTRPILSSIRSTLGANNVLLEWRAIPEGSGVSAKRAHISWVQHGDFSLGNIFLDEQTQRIYVIDWDQCGDGYPPLFDWFCFITSLQYTNVKFRPCQKKETVDHISFQQTYFEPSWFAEAIVTCTHHICEQTGLQRADVAEYFRQYLAVRHRLFHQDSESGDKGLHAKWYEEFDESFHKNRKQCIFQ